MKSAQNVSRGTWEVLAFLLGIGWAEAAVLPGSLDTGFRPQLDGLAPSVSYAVVQSDGKILITGVFDGVGGSGGRSLARLHANGSRDETFNVGTGFGSTDGVVYSETLLLLSDGRILVGGYFDSYNGEPANNLVRLTPNGSRDHSFVIDATFDPGRGAESSSYVVVWPAGLQADGDYLFGGLFETMDTQAQRGLARLNGDPILLLSHPTPGSDGAKTIPVKNTGFDRFVLQASANFRPWIPVATNAAGPGDFDLVDPGAGQFPTRFYRAVALPPAP